MKRLNDLADVKVAVAASAGSVAPLVATKIDATGFGRARFIFNVGNGAATTAAISAGIGVWQASTSGATYAEISGSTMAAVTSGILYFFPLVTFVVFFMIIWIISKPLSHIFRPLFFMSFNP